MFEKILTGAVIESCCVKLALLAKIYITADTCASTEKVWNANTSSVRICNAATAVVAS